MTFPGYPLATTFTNATPNQDVHPAAHNDVNAAANALQDQVTAANILRLTGTGSPEGVVTAGKGSTFQRTDGGTNTTFYVKEAGAGTTGWVANAAGSPDGGDAGTLGGATLAQVRTRSTHSGQMSADFIDDGTTNHAFTAADDTKLASVAVNATAINTYSDVPNFATGWEATRRARNIRINWNTGDETAKLDSTVTIGDSAGDNGTNLTRSIQTTLPPNSGNTWLATPHLRLACPTGVTNGNSRYLFPITGSTSVDSRVRSMWLGPSPDPAGPQMGHFHRGYTRASSGQFWAYTLSYDVAFSVHSNLNLAVWEIDVAGNATTITDLGGANLPGLQKFVDVYASTKSGTTITLIVQQSHKILVGEHIFINTENIYESNVVVVAVVGNKITCTSGTSQTIAFGGVGVHANGAGIMCHDGLFPYWVESELVGNRFRVKAWPVGRAGGEPSYSNADYALQMTAALTAPTTAGTSGLYTGHAHNDTEFTEFGGPVDWTNLDA